MNKNKYSRKKNKVKSSNLRKRNKVGKRKQSKLKLNRKKRLLNSKKKPKKKKTKKKTNNKKGGAGKGVMFKLSDDRKLGNEFGFSEIPYKDYQNLYRPNSKSTHHLLEQNFLRNKSL